MDELKISRHASLRAQQRGRRPNEIGFVVEHGDLVEGGYLLSTKVAQELEQEAREFMNLAHRLRGTFVPVANGVAKTIFKASSHQQSRLLQHRTT